MSLITLQQAVQKQSTQKKNFKLMNRSMMYLYPYIEMYVGGLINKHKISVITSAIKDENFNKSFSCDPRYVIYIVVSGDNMDEFLDDVFLSKMANYSASLFDHTDKLRVVSLNFPNMRAMDAFRRFKYSQMYDKWEIEKMFQGKKAYRYQVSFLLHHDYARENFKVNLNKFLEQRIIASGGEMPHPSTNVIVTEDMEYDFPWVEWEESLNMIVGKDEMKRDSFNRIFPIT